MYDYNFYEQMDSLMVNLLVDLAINMVRVLYAEGSEHLYLLASA